MHIPPTSTESQDLIRFDPLHKQIDLERPIYLSIQVETDIYAGKKDCSLLVSGYASAGLERGLEFV